MAKAGGSGPPGLSERAFGLAFAVVFSVIALLPLVRGSEVRVWALGVAAVLAVAGLAFPKVLAPANAAWHRVTQLINAVLTTLALVVLYYAVVLPTALVMRLRGLDPLRLGRDPAAASYWVPRVPPGPPPDSLDNQF